jgi:dihydroorotate dehydrogenase electron transfer subunit
LSKLFRATVTENKRVIKNHYLLTLRPLKRIKKSRPGNFFMISVESGLDPLLKRPFSVHRSTAREFQILYRVVGKGTTILSKRKQGDVLDVIGPLGNTFPVNKKRGNILVAGGLGIAPIFGLADSIVNSPALEQPLLFYGVRTAKEVLCKKDLAAIGLRPVIATDDGTIGNKGNIVKVLEKFIKSGSVNINEYAIYACGPRPMLKSLSALANKLEIKGYAALEQNMACGIGTCLGCVVHTTGGLKRVCKEGPVFPMEEIIWNK